MVLASKSWPLPCNDVKNSSRSPYKPSLDGSIKWTYNLGAPSSGEVVIGPDGTTYAAADSAVHAIKPDGTQKYVYPAPWQGYIYGLAVTSDNKIYFAGEEQWEIFLLNAAGGLEAYNMDYWGYDVLTYSAIDNTIILVANDGGVYKFNASDLSYVWNDTTFDYASEPNQQATPVMASNGDFYCGTKDGAVAFRANNTRKWQRTGLNINSWDHYYISMSDDESLLYIASYNAVYALNPTNGAIVHSKTITEVPGFETSDTPTIGPDGTIYLRDATTGTNGQYIVALTSTLGYKWGIQVVGEDRGDSVVHGITVDGNGDFWVALDGNTTYSLNSELRRYDSSGVLKQTITASPSYKFWGRPVIDEECNVYIITQGGMLICYGSVAAIPSFFTMSVKLIKQALQQTPGGPPYTTRVAGIVNALAIIIKEAAYPKVGKGAANQNNELNNFDTDAPVFKWKMATEKIKNGPTIDKDGTLYFTSYPAYLYAVNPDGTLKWQKDITPDNDPSSWNAYYAPTIADDGTIYQVVSWGGPIRAYNPDGSLKFSIPNPSYNEFSPIALGADGTLYFDEDYVGVRAYNPNGTHKWTYSHIGCSGTGCPAVDKSGNIYVSTYGAKTSRSQHGEIVCIRPDGSEKWRVRHYGYTPAYVRYGATTVLSADETTLYVIDNNSNNPGTVFAVDTTNGAFKWKWNNETMLKQGAMAHESVSLGPDGTIYVGTFAEVSSAAPGAIIALNTDGTFKWRCLLGMDYDATLGTKTNDHMVISKDGHIFVGSGSWNASYRPRVYCVRPNGTIRWTIEPPDASPAYADEWYSSGPVIDNNGKLYFGTTANFIYCYEK